MITLTLTDGRKVYIVDRTSIEFFHESDSRTHVGMKSGESLHVTETAEEINERFFETPGEGD